jgi:lipoate-protein ligase A
MLRLLESPPCAQDNLALDAGWFERLEAGAASEALHLWESPVPVVVVGRLGAASKEVETEACATDGVAIVRRESGGGAVVLGPGCLNYSLLLSLDRHPALRDVRLSYRLILGRLIHALAVPGLEIRGVSDVAIEGRKVSGNAQRRGSHALLHHGTLLYAFETGMAERYLLEPCRQPDYRARRLHAEFLGNLPLSAGEIRERLSELARVTIGCETATGPRSDFRRAGARSPRRTPASSG